MIIYGTTMNFTDFLQVDLVLVGSMARKFIGPALDYRVRRRVTRLELSQC